MVSFLGLLYILVPTLWFITSKDCNKNENKRTDSANRISIASQRNLRVEEMQRTHTGIREHKKVAKRRHPHFLPPSLPPPPTLPHVSKEPRSLSLLLLVPGSALHTKGRKSPSPTRKPMETQKEKKKNNRNPTKPTTKTEKKEGVMGSGCEDLREDYEGSGINRIRKEKQRQKNIQTQRRAEEDRKIKKTNPSSQRATQ